MTKILERAPAYNPNQLQIATTTENVVLSSFQVSTNVIGAGVTVQLSDATQRPRLGDRHRINATHASSDVSVEDATYAIQGGAVVPYGTAVEYELAAGPAGTLVWVALGGAGGFGFGEMLFADIAAMAAFDDDSVRDRIYGRPLTVDQPFELDKTSTATADGITVVNALSSNAGADPGRWLRMETFNKRWALRTTWYVSYEDGDDENEGSAPLAPLKTIAEKCRRTHQQPAGVNVTTNVLTDVPATDRWRPSPVFEANAESSSGATAIEQVTNETLLGTITATAVVGALTDNGSGNGFVGSSGASQATMGLLGITGGVAGNIGKAIRLTSGASSGAIAWIGKDLGAGVAQTTNFVSAIGVQISSAIAIGVTYEIVDFTEFNGAIIQVGNSQGRYLVANFKFPAQAAAPAPQGLLSQRFASVTSRYCLFSRAPEFGFGDVNPTFSCCFDFTGQTGTGTGNTVGISMFGAVPFLTGCLFLNAELRMVNGTAASLNGCYLQGSRLTTASPVSFTTYGPNLLPGGISQALIQVGAGGLGVYDWPVGTLPNDAGITLTNGSQMVVYAGQNVRGSCVTAGSVGLRVNAGSKFIWLPTGSSAPTITGALADLQLDGAATCPPPPEWNTYGTSTLAAGTLAGIAANLVAASIITMSVRDPGAGAITGFGALDAPVGTRAVGSPGSFTINAIDDAKAVINTATPTVDWHVQTPPAALVTWAQWQAAPFLRTATTGRGSSVQQAATFA